MAECHCGKKDMHGRTLRVNNCEVHGNEAESEHGAVARFMRAMLAKMEIRREKYKLFGWRDPEYKSVDDLREHFNSEIDEWSYSEGKKDEMAELVDVANTAFMLWDRLRLDKNNK